ncbi:bifunctional riboflavin kinase/FAD synthetase [Chthonobacter rhizosphaerae]|uniref:bifunctional riboflavin kinase/FAD synthetase n=1 Tax=Chthonobacter rhizosphaerae TaxID=2735553 RepID=UPI0015EEBCD5|nr:bifunctional riboflavin kinase/FAD synthetase [Chthonobacter rhizosphaerae]
MTGPARSFRATSFAELDSSFTDAHLAIGNFDGMHRGHQAVLDRVRAAAEADGRPALVLTFEPHPRDVFRPDQPVFRLTSPFAKARIAEALGLDGLVTIAFDRVFASTPADAFVRRVVVDGARARSVAVGWNFHFGAGRSGSPTLLAESGLKNGFGVTVVEPFQDEGGKVISSSRIREELEAGRIADAAGLLGYRWFFEAEVVHGDKRGRTIGYPTANVRLPATAKFAHGIYAVMIEIDGVARPGVASFGRRPTFDNGAAVFETHVFDFAGDLYGKTVVVTPVSYLRPEMRFDSVAALVAQMDQDSAEARAALSALTPLTPLDRVLLTERMTG